MKHISLKIPKFDVAKTERTSHKSPFVQPYPGPGDLIIKVVVRKEIYVLSITFDEVLPTHPQMTLIEVDNPLCRVLDVSRNREVEEIVCAVALRSEAVIQLLPGMDGETEIGRLETMHARIPLVGQPALCTGIV